MYMDIEVTPEEKDEMIGKIAQKIHAYDLDVAAIFMIDSLKPLSFIGTQMGRFFVSPFLPILGENIGISGEKFFKIFEKQENSDKLIKAIEKLNHEKEEKKKTEKANKLEEKKVKPKRKGWRRILPY